MVEAERRLRAALDWLLEQDTKEVHASLARADDELEYDAARECLTGGLREETGYIDLTVSSSGTLAVTVTEGSLRIIHSMRLPSTFLAEQRMRE